MLKINIKIITGVDTGLTDNVTDDWRTRITQYPEELSGLIPIPVLGSTPQITN
jgi:hypothetical protein